MNSNSLVYVSSVCLLHLFSSLLHQYGAEYWRFFLCWCFVSYFKHNVQPTFITFSSGRHYQQKQQQQQKASRVHTVLFKVAVYWRLAKNRVVPSYQFQVDQMFLRRLRIRLRVKFRFHFHRHMMSSEAWIVLQKLMMIKWDQKLLFLIHLSSLQ